MEDPRGLRVPASTVPSTRIEGPAPPEPGSGQTAAHFSQNRWGIRTRGFPTRPTATTTAGDALGGNAKRLFWMVINRGATDVNLDVGTVAASGNGVLLAAGGGYASMDVLEDAEAITQNVSVIAASGTPQLWAYEITSY